MSFLSRPHRTSSVTPENQPATEVGSTDSQGSFRAPRKRTLVVTATTLACLVAVAPLLPDRESPRPEGRPSAQSASAGTLSATEGTVDAEMQAEIDRVVAEGMQQSRVSAKATPGRLAETQVRCAEFEGQNYCLGQGWTEDSEAQVQYQAGREISISARRGSTENTGDLSFADSLRQRAAMSPQARAKAERQELTDAAKSVAKVILLRYEIQGIPLPDGFLARHPEARLVSRAGSSAATGAQRKKASDYPQRSTIIRANKASEQVRSYWCGPATMQMIEHSWSGTREPQSTWAKRLGTTTSGSAITSLVSVTNRYTGWDNANRAGTYITLDIRNYSFNQWYLLMMRHIEDYRAPVILHPLLYKEWYPYLDDNASGHFQMGRGYDKRGSKPDKLSYFEPWNQQRFDPSEPYIKRLQWRSAYNQYRSNQAHFQHNVGV